MVISIVSIILILKQKIHNTKTDKAILGKI
jgi:hypothetical protein